MVLVFYVIKASGISPQINVKKSSKVVFLESMR